MTRHTFALLLFSVAPAAVFGQENVDLPTIHRIKDEAFRGSHVMDHLFYLTDVNGPRLTNSPGFRAAADWSALEAMRILKALDLPMDRTVRIALWSGEEQGLYGSRGYVKEHFGDPVTMTLKPEHAKLAAYFNVDNGRGKIRLASFVYEAATRQQMLPRKPLPRPLPKPKETETAATR
jgi:hypothetical protein